MLTATLIAYLLVLLGIGVWAQRRTGDSADFHLAGRRMGPFVAALSASASSSSAWTLLGVSGAAWHWGIQAVWLIPATFLGFLLNWFVIAPRLHLAGRASGALTLVEVLATGPASRSRSGIRIVGSLIILFSFVFYVAAQFQAAGTAMGTALPLGGSTALIVGAMVVIGYVFLGGFWAASISDALQGLMMLGVAVVLPLVALTAVGGLGELWAGLAALEEPGLLKLVDQPNLLLALVFVAGLFGIGLGYPGQPHVVNRFMALERSEQIPRGRVIALPWALLTFSGMVLLGWCGRVLLPELTDPEAVLLSLSSELLPAALGGLVTGGVLAAIMSTADSQLLVAGSSASHDLTRGRFSLLLDRSAILLVGLAAVLLALYIPATIFERVLFAWQSLGNAFGPLLLVLLLGGPLAMGWRLLVMVTGFGLTVIISAMPDVPGDAAQRLIPFAVALLLALIGLRCSRCRDAPAAGAPLSSPGRRV